MDEIETWHRGKINELRRQIEKHEKALRAMGYGPAQAELELLQAMTPEEHRARLESPLPVVPYPYADALTELPRQRPEPREQKQKRTRRYFEGGAHEELFRLIKGQRKRKFTTTELHQLAKERAAMKQSTASSAIGKLHKAGRLVLDADGRYRVASEAGE